MKQTVHALCELAGQAYLVYLVMLMVFSLFTRIKCWYHRKIQRKQDGPFRIYLPHPQQIEPKELPVPNPFKRIRSAGLVTAEQLEQTARQLAQVPPVSQKIPPPPSRVIREGHQPPHGPESRL